MSAGLILVAGGSGKRFQESDEQSASPQRKKQYFLLQNKPVFIHTLEKFIDIAEISEVVIVCPTDDLEYVKSEVENYSGTQKVMKFVSGGSERVYSVINGFQNISENVNLVLIHDAVRPFIEKSTIIESIAQADAHGASIVAVPVTDTLKSANDKQIIERTVDRDKLYRAQTPQTFRKELFAKAVENWKQAGEPRVTDDAMLAEMLGIPVKIVVGSYSNIKITTREDILIAESMLNSQNKPE